MDKRLEAERHHLGPAKKQGLHQLVKQRQGTVHRPNHQRPLSTLQVNACIRQIGHSVTKEHQSQSVAVFKPTVIAFLLNPPLKHLLHLILPTSLPHKLQLSQTEKIATMTNPADLESTTSNVIPLAGEKYSGTYRATLGKNLRNPVVKASPTLPRGIIAR